MKAPGHLMILASAGSGKTYALTHRFVQLLAGGAAPERIAALTFTRKAAGEFFDEILKKLARAAADAAAARQLAAEIGAPRLGPADFLAHLRAVTDSLHRLNLGTIDGFFARVVRAFPLELGLGGEFEILETHAARRERRQVLRRMFAHAGDDAARRDFIEAFKRATFGVEEKRLGSQLDQLLDDHAESFRAAPEPEQWGRPERIWPEGCPWLEAADPRRRAAAAAALQAALPWAACTDRQRERWEDFLAALPEWAPGGTLPKPVAYLLNNALAAWPELREVTVERKKFALGPAAADALRAVVGGVVGAELARRLERTRGIHAVLRGYEAAYDGAVRRRGRLTFADLQRLLEPGGGAGARVLSRVPAAEARLFIDWRLDAQIDHWLLDEFQDTSFGQWSVLRNLIDEAVQDPTGARSFFYVGDVKQAIFGWRGGDVRLFREIFDHYNAAAPDDGAEPGPGSIGEQRLRRSFRSGPPVIAMVNRVFGDPGALRALFPEDAVARWQREWDDHESARPELGGYAELHTVADDAARFAGTLAILQETEPLERGLTVAVLVQKNQTAAELADYLRREGGLPAVAESDQAVGTDNPLTCALLALFRAAAHPGDTAAWAHLAMTPLATVQAAEGCATPDALVARVLGEIHAQGFARTVEAWLRRVEPHLAADDDFSRERGRQLAEAARRFDATGSREVAEFAEFVAAFTVREPETASVVRVMTVHAAKGLGFDLVILPDLEGQKLAARRSGLALARVADRSVEWVLDLPNEVFRANDPVLAAHVAAAEADACYEEFAVLYVAMTRAKRAMYVLTKEVGKSQSHNFPRWLRETLGETWSAGDPRWWQALPRVAPTDAETTAEAGADEKADAPRALRRPAHRPSTRGGAAVPAGRLFALEGGGAAEFGRAVHERLAGIEWLEPADAEARAQAWEADGSAGAAAAACLRAPALAEVWARPAGAESAEVWRERAFEIVLDGAWISGVFDRVVIVRDAAGRARRAVVYDFKTDRVERAGEAVARHAEQVELYRRVVAVLTGLPAEAVAAELVLTATRERVVLARV